MDMRVGTPRVTWFMFGYYRTCVFLGCVVLLFAVLEKGWRVNFELFSLLSRRQAVSANAP